MGTPTSLLHDLRDRYLELHTRKEDLFWAAKMGLTDDPDATARALSDAEIALNRFLQDPERLRVLRAAESDPTATDAERKTLRGWIAMFAAHVIEDPDARALSERIVEAEAELARRRARMELGYLDPHTGRHRRASSVELSLLQRSAKDEATRRAAYEGLRSIEVYVLEHGFLDLVAMRNRLGRTLGYEDFYDWRTSVVERMRKRDVFRVLDDLANRTAEHTRERLAAFAREHGEGALAPWNFGFLRSGRILEAIDPYFRFEDALSRWVRSFGALGVRYRGATLTLDLVDRPFKYENGFMHGPGPAFFDGGTWRPARINFTANAVPGATGSGLRATETLFHEGGHAAHFANILADAPCFSQEFAPTSVAYAETQSMFMDSLLGDADWRVRYARDASGAPMPEELVLDAVRQTQPLRGFDVRAMLTVPFAERALYEMTDAERTPEHVLATFRRIERELQGLEAGVRPVLAVPHLLAGESSAYYHGYVLAEMAVHQTRAFFLGRDGYLTDNPRVGPDLARAYWAPGNSVTFDETLRALCGCGLDAGALAEVCNRDVDDALALAREAIAAQKSRPIATGPVDLDAVVRVVHGRELICDSGVESLEACAERFARWIGTLEAEARARAQARTSSGERSSGGATGAP
jgi:hypothetical protein